MKCRIITALIIAHRKPLSTLCISVILSYLHRLHADSIRHNISEESDWFIWENCTWLTAEIQSFQRWMSNNLIQCVKDETSGSQLLIFVILLKKKKKRYLVTREILPFKIYFLRNISQKKPKNCQSNSNFIRTLFFLHSSPKIISKNKSSSFVHGTHWTKLSQWI